MRVDSMLDKSEENDNAAFLLKQCGYYAGSVNRSYYSVYQYILSLYQPDVSDCESDSSHITTINNFCQKFLPFRVRKLLIGEIVDLKKLRKKADYEDASIDEKLADKAFKKCQLIKRKINDNK